MYDIGFRRAVLLLYNTCHSIRKTAAVMKCSTASVSRWARRIEPLSWRRRSVITERLVDVVKATLLARPNTTCQQIAATVRDMMGIDVSRQLIHNIVSRTLKFTYKRSRKRGAPRRQDKHKETMHRFVRDYVNAQSLGHLIVSIDESGFDTDSHPRYGYAPCGKRHIIKFVRSSDRRHHSLIMAIDNRGGRKYELETKTVDGPRFLRFMQSLQYPAGTLIVMDNHTIHWTEPVLAFMKERGYVALRMPAYSPELNPIEMVFGIAKNAWYALDHRGDTVATVHETIRRIVDSVKETAIRNCFEHVRREHSNACDNGGTLSEPRTRDPLFQAAPSNHGLRRHP